MPRAYVGLGSNLAHPVKQVLYAADCVAAVHGIYQSQLSNLYRNPPVGPVAQPPFVNAVLAIDTILDPHTLFAHLREIEAKMGRVREIRWGPRIIDLDLLLYGDVVLQTLELEIPHPRVVERDFVLKPLYDVAPALVLPNGRSLQAWHEAHPTPALIPILPSEVEHVSCHSEYAEVL